MRFNEFVNEGALAAIIAKLKDEFGNDPESGRIMAPYNNLYRVLDNARERYSRAVTKNPKNKKHYDDALQRFLQRTAHPHIGYDSEKLAQAFNKFVDMIEDDVNETSIKRDLHKKLPSLQKRNYSDWIQGKLKGKLEEEVDQEIQDEVSKFASWACKRLSIENPPEVILSLDTNKAQSNPATGQFVLDDDKIWVYADKRNLIDILRTVFHELVHYRQHQIGMIKPNDSYPGSPIEAMADMLAGKYIKIYGKQNPHVFQ